MLDEDVLHDKFLISQNWSGSHDEFIVANYFIAAKLIHWLILWGKKYSLKSISINFKTYLHRILTTARASSADRKCAINIHTNTGCSLTVIYSIYHTQNVRDFYYVCQVARHIWQHEVCWHQELAFALFGNVQATQGRIVIEICDKITTDVNSDWTAMSVGHFGHGIYRIFSQFFSPRVYILFFLEWLCISFTLYHWKLATSNRLQTDHAITTTCM